MRHAHWSVGALRIQGGFNAAIVGWQWRFWSGNSDRLMLCLAMLAIAMLRPATAAGCDPDVAALEPDYCKYFVHYIPAGAGKTDDRITSRIAPSAAASASVRSFALVIGINIYPNFKPIENQTLAPAKYDVQHLVPFLKEQGFDEIIVLENEAATKQNIDHFLDIYLNKQLNVYGPTARVLVAHTGHGGPGDSINDPGNMILSNADGAADYDNIYSLGQIAQKLRKLSGKSFHFVALFGSCYSGSIFASHAPGGSNYWFPKAPGGHAVSSTPHDDLAYGLGGSQGSIFFDSLIAGVKSGLGDPVSAGWAVGESGDLHLIGGGIVRLGALTSYISGKIDELGLNPTTKKAFPQILIGTLSDSDHNGAFFFVGPPKVEKVDISRNGFAKSASTDDRGSALLENSSIKVFSAPDSYQINGIDISHYNETIDWPQVRASKFDFVYMKATESVTLKDNRFFQNWAGARGIGLRTGAYHVFDYCESPVNQLKNIRETVQRDAAAMPIALDLQWYRGPASPRQRRCAEIGATKASILSLLSGIEEAYGKTPIIFANQSGLADLIDDTFLKYPIWLQYYADKDSEPLANLQIKGKNTWSLWQHSSKGRVPGIPGDVDLDVFFGNREAFGSYVGGQGNLPLKADRR